MDKNNFFHINKTLNCAGKLLDLSTPLIMGILNVTPDSFYDGGRYINSDPLLKQVEKMLAEGAGIIDVGGMSSRPGAAIISEEEELKRVIKPIELIGKNFPEAIISIDTIHSKVARLGIEAGASIINDVSAGNIDKEILRIAAAYKTPYILMHMKGMPNTMQKDPNYENLLLEITDFFIEKIKACNEAGINDIVLDPGLGFGKSLNDNYLLLKRLRDFDFLQKPILIGASRKSMIYKLLECSPEEALNGTTAAHTMALMNGASILRVHDVKAAKEAILLYKAYNNA